MARAIFALVVAALLFVGGCVGGPAYDGPLPDRPWAGATPHAAVPATRPLRDESSKWPGTSGVTSASPERIAEAARATIERAYGPLKAAPPATTDGYVRRVWLTPRYDVSSLGRDYRWLEVCVLVAPGENRSLVEVRERQRSHGRIVELSHGGFWLFPPARVAYFVEYKERALLAAVLQRLGDPEAYLTSWENAQRRG